MAAWLEQNENKGTLETRRPGSNGGLEGCLSTAGKQVVSQAFTRAHVEYLYSGRRGFESL